MRIGFVSDTHFRIDDDNSYLERLIGETDVVLSGGDWGVVPFSLDEREKYAGKVFTIYGNHDDPNVLASYGILLDEGVNTVKGLKVCAIHGILKPFQSEDSPGLRELGEFINLAQLFLEADVGVCDILLLHAPPGYVYDDGRAVGHESKYHMSGFLSHRIVDVIVSVLKPRLVLCGHTHSRPFWYGEFPLRTEFGDFIHVPTLLLISVLGGTYAIIDYDEKGRKVEGISVFSGGERVFFVRPDYGNQM